MDAQVPEDGGIVVEAIEDVTGTEIAEEGAEETVPLNGSMDMDAAKAEAAVSLVPGGSENAKWDAGKTSSFKFTVTENDVYEISCRDYAGDGYGCMHIYYYYEDSGSYSLWYVANAANQAQDFSVTASLGTGTYYVLVSDMADLAGSCDVFLNTVDVESLEITQGPGYTRLVSGADCYPVSRPLSGMSLRAVYSNGETYDISNIPSDSSVWDQYGQAVGWQLYEKAEDGSKGNTVSLYDGTLSGSYLLEVSLGDAGAQTTVEVCTPSEAAGTSVEAGTSVIVDSNGNTICVSFTPTADGVYTFHGTDLEWIGVLESGSSFAAAYADTVKAALTAGQTYCIAGIPDSAAPDQITVSVEDYRTITEIVMEGTESGAADLYGYLRSYPISVVYSDGQGTVSGWENAWADGYDYFRGTASNGDTISLKLYDSEGQQVSAPTSNGVYNGIPLGQYTLKAQVEDVDSGDGTEAVVSQTTLTVKAIPNSAVVLELGTPSEAIPMTENDTKYFAFTVPEDGTYSVSMLGASGIGYGGWEYVYRDGAVLGNLEGGYRHELSAGDIWLISPALGMNEVDTVTVTVTQKGVISEISASPDSEYCFADAAERLRYLTAIVTYSDGGTTYDYWWEQAYDDAGNCYYYKDVWYDDSYSRLIMTLADRAGNQVSMPSDESIPVGDYTLHISAEGSSVEAAYDITIEGAPDDAVSLNDGPASYQIDGDSQYFVFTPEETGRYILQLPEAEEVRIGIFCKESNTLLSKIYSDWFYGGGSGFTGELTEGREYVVELVFPWDESGTVSFVRQRQIKSAEVLPKETYSAFTASQELASLKCEITYEDGSAETLEDFSGAYITDEVRGFEAYTSEGHHMVLRLKRDGEPVSIDGLNTPAGALQLELLADGAAVDTKDIQITMPSEDELPELLPGAAADIQLAGGAAAVYRIPVTEETAGTYCPKCSFEGKAGVYLVSGSADGLRDEGVYYYPNEEGAESEARWELEPGTTWYLYVKALNYGGIRGTLELRKEIGIESLEFDGSITATWIEGIYSFSDLKDAGSIPGLRVDYEDGTSEKFSVDDTFGFQRGTRIDIYGVKDDGTVDESQEYYEWRTLEAGNYVLVFKLTDFYESWNAVTLAEAQLPFTVVTLEEAAREHPFENGSVSMEGMNGFYGAALYTAETAGTVAFTSSLKLSEFRVYDLDGNRFASEEAYRNGAYTYSVALDAGESCILLMKSESGAEYTVTTERSTQIESAALSAMQTELIAGLDTISKAGLRLQLAYSDGTGNTMGVSDKDAYGNRFRYAVKDKDTDTEVSSSQPLKIGTYLVQAVHRTLSSIMASTEVSAVGVDTASLPVIEPEQDTVLRTSGGRRLYAFTAGQDGRYVLENDAGISWEIYEAGAEGLEKVSGELAAGTTYVLCVEAVPAARTVKLTANIQVEELSPDTTASATLENQQTKIWSFTPGVTGNYVIAVGCPDADDTGAMICEVYDGMLEPVDENWISAEDAESRSYYFLESGETYQIRVTNYSAAGQCRLQIIERPEFTGCKITPKPADQVEGYYADYADVYLLSELFDITFTYSDGSSQSIGGSSVDPYGYRLGGWSDGVGVYFDSALSADGKVKSTFGYSVYDGSGWNCLFDGTAIQYLEPSPDAVELKAGEAVDVTAGPDGRNYFLFCPEESGSYWASVSGLADYTVYNVVDEGSYCYAEIMEGHYAELVKGRTYRIAVDAPGAAGTDYQIAVRKKQEAVKLEIVTEPEPTVKYSLFRGMNKLEAKLTYADGTSALLSWGQTDAYGNTLNCYSRALSSDKVRVYAECADLQAFCDVENLPVSGLPALSENSASEFALVHGSNEIYAVFTPSESGTYTAGISVSGTDEVNNYGVQFFDTATDEGGWGAVDMEAGRTYVMVLRYYYESEASGTLSVTPVRADRDNCEGEHTFGAWTVTKAATCITQGVEARVCSVCGYTETRNTATVDHDYGEWKVTKTATCTEAGEERQTCKICGDEQIREIAATGHSYGEWEVTKAATCTENGEETQTCENCGDEQSRAIPATGHSYGEWKVTKAATCTENGEEAQTCENCGDEQSREITAIGHSYGEWRVTKAATCTEAGEETQTCKNCGDEQSRVIPATGHDYGEWEVTTEVTCTTNGVKTKTCKNCGDEQTEEIPAPGHIWGEWETYKDATCTENGTQYRSCTRTTCTEMETRIIPAAGHQYGEEQMDEETGETYVICSVCNDRKVIIAGIDPVEADKIEQAKKDLEAAANPDSGTTDAILVETITEIDNQAVIDSGSMDLITGLEEKLLSPDSTDTSITGTVASSQSQVQRGEGVGSEDVAVSGVEGAAVTVAALLNNPDTVSGFEPDADTSYAAQLMVTDNGVQQDKESNKQSYHLEITMNIVADDGNGGAPETVASNVPLEAPIRITISIPALYWNGTFKLYHAVSEGQDVEVSYNKGENNTITFCAPSLSPWRMELEACGSHELAEDTAQRVESTCHSLGKKVEVCGICGFIQDSPIAMTAHDLVETRTEPTCTENGQVVNTCQNEGCGYSTTETLSSTGHAWSEWTELSAATCTADGVEVRTCGSCKATEKRTGGSKLGHAWASTGTVTKQPTCTAAGITTYRCTRSGCTETMQKSEPAATGHSYGAYVVTKQPTALAAGVKTRTCTKCGNKENAAVAKLTPVLTVNASSLKLKAKQTSKAFKVTQMASGDYVASVKSSNTKVLKVTYTAQGAITLKAQKKTGTAKLTITLASGLTKTVSVKVQKTAVKTTKVNISQRKLTLKKGQSASLAPVISPITSVEKVTYKSSKKKVATVSSKGVIKAKKKGTTVITVKSGKKKITCKVTVK